MPVFSGGVEGVVWPVLGVTPLLGFRLIDPVVLVAGVEVVLVCFRGEAVVVAGVEADGPT